MLALKLILLVLPLVAAKLHQLHSTPPDSEHDSLEDLNILRELHELNKQGWDDGFPKLDNASELGAGLDGLNTARGFGEAMSKGLIGNWFKISRKCKRNVWYFVKGLLGRRKKLWALLMFDSSSRFPSGLGTGNIVDMGFFDECLDIEATIWRPIKNEIIRGQHCIANLPLKDLIKTPKATPSRPLDSVQNLKTDIFQADPRFVTAQKGLGLQFSLCVPDTCSVQDLKLLFSEKFAFYEDLCQTKENMLPEINGEAIGAISFLGVILAVMAATTIYDIFLHVMEKEALHSLLIAFSVLTNGKKLLKTSSSADQVSCLHGIRVISTMWVIIGHRYMIYVNFPNRNHKDIYDWFQTQHSMFILNAPLAVDTFFFMSGLVVSYVFLIATAKGVRFNVPLFYLHRYLRLAPVMAVIVLIHAILFPYFGTGPFFPSAVETLTPVCREKWWKPLLFIQNYGVSDTDHLCIAQSWYLSVDMQLFILSPILLVPLKRWPFPTVVAASFLTLCSVLVSFLLGWFMELSSHPLTNAIRDTKDEYLQWYYVGVYTRAAPWLIGFILGYYIFQFKQGKLRLKMHGAFVLVMWVLALAVLGTVAFTGHKILFEYDRLADSLHMALARPAWAIGLSWVVLACTSGHGGPVDWFLSAPVFQVVSKLTYTLYLVHFQIITIPIAKMRAPLMFGDGQLMYGFWGDFAGSLACALAFTLAFESPVIVLEQVLFRSGKKKPKPVTSPKSPAECA